MRKVLFLAAAAVITSPVLASAENEKANGWINHPLGKEFGTPVVLQFRREVPFERVPKSFVVRVTADNRYVLYVNGKRVAAGPSTGDVSHWRERTIDLAPYLKQGGNVIAAVVWNGVKTLETSATTTAQQRQRAEAMAVFTQTAPAFQQSVATGFRLVGEAGAASISTSAPGWRVHRDEGRSFGNGYRQLIRERLFYVAGQPETIDAAKADFDPSGATEGWVEAAPAPEAAARTLVPDRLPPQMYVATSPGQVVRTTGGVPSRFPAAPYTVPPRSRTKLLVQRDTMISAYPQIEVSGGAGATMNVTWAEALYDAERKKGDRNLVSDRKILGMHDTFLPDGRRRTFAPLWWRTWRYAEIDVETKDEPLVLHSMNAFETGYPFAQIARFQSSDPALKRIFDVGWRTARIDAHETYMDTAYWEQLQYAGDTRLQMLISYAVAGDARLAEQAIDAFGNSNVAGGLIDGAYPQRTSNVIPPFSLTWVAMLEDWRMQQPDPAPIVRNLGRMRQAIAWFDQWQQKSGLLGQNGHWSFIDWVGQTPADRTLFPSYGSTNESCLMSVLWLGALQQAGRIEAALGSATIGQSHRTKADRVRAAVRQRCWVANRGLFSDNPEGKVFSQHMNALAVLYDVATPDEASGILGRIVAPGKGIDAPAGMFTTSYYFSWYLARAFEHAGQGDRYLDLVDTWRQLLELNYTTWPEERGETRSDTHAWSAHPTADLLGIVAGIAPAEPGYRSVRISPSLGRLTSLDATAATPSGPVTVSYKVRGEKLLVEIDRPRTLPGTFHWRGRDYPLTRVKTKLQLARR